MWSIGVAAVMLAACGSGESSPLGRVSGVARDSRTRLAQTSRQSTAEHAEFVYVADFGTDSVSAFEIIRGGGDGGALSTVPGSPFRAGTYPIAVAIDPNGKFAYVACTGYGYSGSGVSAYTIDSSTGVLTAVAGSPFRAGDLPEGVAIHPNGAFAYVTAGGGVSAFAINQTTGAPTPVAGSPFGAGTTPWGVAIIPSGKFAYVANRDSDNISAYRIKGNGALIAVKGSPFAAGMGPKGVAIDPNGAFAYVANESSNNVSAYTIDATSGKLTPIAGSPFPSGTTPQSVTIDPEGRFAYVANLGSGTTEGDGNVWGYRIDASSGALTPAAGSPFGGGIAPEGAATEPSGKFAYTTDASGGHVWGYGISNKSGSLTPVRGSPFGNLSGPRSVATCRVSRGACRPPPL
ncbi:MAG: beta-propeller fold lactonase family protein [Candidatus Cybelea sp.]